MMRNKGKLGNDIVLEAQQVLRSRLPEGWRIDCQERLGAMGDPSVDAQFRVRGPDGRTARLEVYSKRVLQPRDVLMLHMYLQNQRSTNAVVVAPYLSPAVRGRLQEAGLGFIDLTGSIRIVLSSPGLFIEASGADVNPDRQHRPSRSLRGSKAGRIVRVLVDRREPPGVRELAGLAGVNPGYVSRIAALLDEQALIERSGRGRILSVDWAGLLERWSQDAPLSSRGEQTTCLDPRGIRALTSRLGKSNLRYSITGTLAVSEFAPVAATRLAVVYVESIDDAVSTLDLRISERGANVILIEPEDYGVFEGSTSRNGLNVVAVSQAAADLLTSPGRGPSEAEALISWMRENEGVWRG